MISRRGLIQTGLCLIASPAIVRASSLMPVRAWVEPLLYEADFLHLVSPHGVRSVLTHDIGSDLFATMTRAIGKERHIIGARFLCSRNMREEMDRQASREKDVILQVMDQIPVDYSTSFRGIPIEVI